MNYEYEKLGGLVFCAGLPPDELRYRSNNGGGDHSWHELTLSAQIDALGTYADQCSRLAGGLAGPVEDFADLAADAMREIYAPRPRAENFGLLRMGQKVTLGFGKLALARARIRTQDEYFATAPPVVEALSQGRLLSDELFGHLRVAGLNAVLLRTATDRAQVEAAAKIDAVKDQLQTTGDSLDAALAERRLYVVPHEAFAIIRTHLREGVELEHPHRRRFVSTPTAVFVRPPQGTLVLPVAICFDDHLPNSPATLTPSDDSLWMRAKLHYQVADSLCHTFVHHLPQTHFLLEPIVIASRRHFGSESSPSHPVGRLLSPHLEGTIAVNHIAKNTLFSRYSPFSEIIGTTADSTRAIVEAAFSRRANDFASIVGASDLVDDPDLVYPLRDDYEPSAAALRHYVEQFVDLHYPDAAAVTTDSVLQTWADEIRDPQRAGLPGFPLLSDKASLANALATIVEIASLQHAAFHFPQTDLGRFAILAPFCAAELRPGIDPAAEASLEWIDTLPELDVAAWQSFILGQSYVHWKVLAKLPGSFALAQERALAQALASTLAVEEQRMRHRDAELVDAGYLPYPYLRASEAPCSINT